MDIDHTVYIEGDILYLNFGYLRAGDLSLLSEKIEKILSTSPNPRYSIVDFNRLIAKDSLIHPEDWEEVQALIERGKEIGFQKAFWIIPENSLILDILKKKVILAANLTFVDSKEAAEKEIRILRN